MPVRFLSGLILLLSIAVAGFARAQEHDAKNAEHGEHHEHIGIPVDAVGLATYERPEEIRQDLAIFTFVVFLLLLAILWKFAWGPIVQGLEKREQSIAGQIADAQRINEEARQLLAQYEVRLAGAADKVRELMEEARRDAEHTKQEILAEAKAGADAERQRALRDIEGATDQALKTLAERSADLAVELAGKFVKSQLTAADHARLVQEAMAKFPPREPQPELTWDLKLPVAGA